MVTIHKIRVAWTGLPGAPGVSTFHCSGPPGTMMADLRTFFEAVKATLPTSCVLTYPSTGVDIDSSTGLATGTWSASAPSPTTGTNPAAYIAPAGAVVNWKTGFFAGGRELRGKTFLVPLASDTYQNDGSLNNTNRTSFQTAATALVSSGGNMIIYSRRNGATAPVTSATVPDKAVVLRSRRD